MNYVKEEDNWIFAECAECNMIMKFRKNNLKFNEDKYVLREPIMCFCGQESNIIENVPEDDKVIYSAPINTPISNVPHCPTCGSTNVAKISLGSKAASGAMFGIFSSNIRNTYKCNNCGYKW